MKLDCFLSDIWSGKYISEIITIVYTIEFQQCGLPYVHIVFWCHSSNKCQLPTDIDRFIIVEILDESTNPLLFETFKKSIVHDPYGMAKPSSPRISNKWYTKHYLFIRKQWLIKMVLLYIGVEIMERQYSKMDMHWTTDLLFHIIRICCFDIKPTLILSDITNLQLLSIFLTIYIRDQIEVE